LILSGITPKNLKGGVGVKLKPISFYFGGYMIGYTVWFKANMTILKEIYISEFPGKARTLDGFFRWARTFYDDWDISFDDKPIVL